MGVLSSCGPTLPHLGGRDASRGTGIREASGCCGGLLYWWPRHVLALRCLRGGVVIKSFIHTAWGLVIYTISRGKHDLVKIYYSVGGPEGPLKVFAHPKPPVRMGIPQKRGPQSVRNIHFLAGRKVNVSQSHGTRLGAGNTWPCTISVL